jgi:hypothetical protein
MSGWISVEEKLPEIGSFVICFGLVYKTLRGVYVAVYYPDTFFERCVTHWQPLPEPPK